MKDQQIYELAQRFRTAIEEARDDGRFDDGTYYQFHKFPKACCGHTCELLAEFLRANGQESIYVWGEDHTGQTHAWLVVKNECVRPLKIHKHILLADVGFALARYGNRMCGNVIVTENHEETGLKDGLIIDLTGDQFGGIPLYVDYYSDFFTRFEFCAAHDYSSLGDDTLRGIYQIILQYL